MQTLLDDNRHLVMALRDELLAKSELVGDEIVDVLREAEARKRLDDGTPPDPTSARLTFPGRRKT